MPPSTLRFGSAPSKGRPISSAAPAAALFCKDVGAHARRRSRIDFGFREPLPVASFEQIYPAAERHFLGDLEQPIATTDLIPFAELAKTELYRQWAQPQGFVDFLSAVIDRTAISSAIFGVFRHERNGIVDDRARRQMRLIAPHIRRAVLIGRMFEFKAAEVATFVDTLDGLSAGMYLVDAEGRLIHANAAGNAILAASDILSSVGGRLVARDAQVQRTLAGRLCRRGSGRRGPGQQGDRRAADRKGRRALCRPRAAFDFGRAPPRRRRLHGRRGVVRSQGGPGGLFDAPQVIGRPSS